MTIKDIAEQAGVSLTTVSNVINNNAGRVSQTTIEKIRKIIDESGYIPNRNARALAKKSTRIIGVVFPRGQEGFLKDPYHSQILSGIEQVLREEDFFIMVHAISNYRELQELTANWGVEGVIVLSLLENSPPGVEVTGEIPFVFIDTYFEGCAYSNIGADDFQGGYLAARHLQDMGHSKIGYIAYGIPAAYSSGVIEKRIQGFSSALAERNQPFNPSDDVFYCENSRLDAPGEEEALLNFISEKTGICVSADLLAAQIMRVLKNHGLSIPEDISIVGYDDLYICELLSPPLTTVHQNITEKGRFGARTLVKHIQSPDKRSPNLRLENHLIKRESVKLI